MDLLNPIYTEKAECQDCYKCLRECTVKAIKVEGGRAAVVPELCVLCGHCVQICPVGAKRVRMDLPRAKHLVETKPRVVVSLAPSFASEFSGITPEELVAALKKLGIWAVSETARGADLVARRVAAELSALAEGDSKKGQVIISSACPTVVEYIKKYRPVFSAAVTGLYSPLQAHGVELKKMFGQDLGILFIGPCISKKRESDLHKGIVDVAIDFNDLRQWFDEAGVSPEAMEPGPDDAFIPSRSAKGALYPIDGGMIAAIKKYPVPKNTSFMAFSSIQEIEKALAGFEPAKLDGPVFLELLACPGGCINGPRSRKLDGTVVKRLSVISYAREASDHSEAPEAALTHNWVLAPIREKEPSAEEIAQVLRRAGKYSVEDELNCGTCGYDTCRDFARAMIIGKAELRMCVSYMRKLAQKKANGLIRSIPSAVVIVDKDLRIVECNVNFAKMIGEDAEQLWETQPGMEGAQVEKLVPFHRYFRDVLLGAPVIDRDIRFKKRILHVTVFGIERGEYAGGVFQDVTAPWVRKDRVVSHARKVITKNLAVVQKIAFLLGENAAETESILNSIIESFEDSDSEKQL